MAQKPKEPELTELDPEPDLPEAEEAEEPEAAPPLQLGVRRRRRRKVRSRAASSRTSGLSSSGSPSPREPSELSQIRRGYAQVADKGGKLAHGALPVTGIRLESKAEYVGDLAARASQASPLVRSVLLAGLTYGIWVEIGYFLAVLLLAAALDVRIIQPQSFVGLAARKVLGDELAIREEELAQLELERQAAAATAGVPRWQPGGASPTS